MYCRKPQMPIDMYYERTALIGDNSKEWTVSVDPFSLLRNHLQGLKIESKNKKRVCVFS